MQQNVMGYRITGHVSTHILAALAHNMSGVHTDRWHAWAVALVQLETRSISIFFYIGARHMQTATQVASTHATPLRCCCADEEGASALM